MIDTPNKWCARCREDKPREEFYRNRRYKDGLQSYCIACHKEYYREYYPANIDDYKTRSKLWCAKNPKYHSEYNRKWYRKNRENRLAQTREYYQKNRDKRKAQIRANYFRKRAERLAEAK